MLALAPRYRAVLPPPLPLERLVAGRSRAEVAALLPRVFNLCGGAQELAARMAMRLPVPDGLVAQAAQQVRRDHLFTLLLRLPPLLGLPTAPLPEPQDVQAALFGPGGLAAAESDPSGFLAGGAGIAPLLAHLRRAVPQGALCAPRTPYPDAATVLSPQASENSPAGRRHDHVLLQAIEADEGRGPVWRMAGRAVDAVLPPPPPISGPGWAVVAAARGAYGLRVRLAGDTVMALHRHAPTDHLLAPGGAMQQALETLPSLALAPLLLCVLDPCVAVEIDEVNHA